MLQCQHRVKGDWIIQTENDLKDFHIKYNFENLQSISQSTFKKIVKTKAKEYLFCTLLKKKDHHSKMKNLVFNDFSMQPYLTNPDISIDNKKLLLSWRIHMARFEENYRGGRSPVRCKLCNDHLDNQEGNFECTAIRDKINIQGNYQNIFNPSSSELPRLANILQKTK